MNGLGTLLKLKLKIFFNSIKFSTKIERIRILFLTVIGIVFFLSSYIISYEVVIYISTLPVIGSLFTIRIIALALLTSFVMVIFSSLIATFSTMYDNEDIEFLFSLPLNNYNIFLYKFILTFFYSSWMLVAILIPFVISFAVAKNFTFIEIVIMIVGIIIKALIAVCIGVIIAVLLSYFFPSKKVKNVVIVVLILSSAIFYSLFRMSEPEKLLSPERFSELLHYLDFMSKPVARWLPSWWTAEIFRGFMIKDVQVVNLNILKLFLLAILFITVLTLVGSKIFCLSLFRKNVAIDHKKHLSITDVSIKVCSINKAIIGKEIKQLLREPVQWVQLVVVVALTIIYLFSISRLPIELRYVKITVAFFNLMGIMSILIAIVLRFIFVQPSLEYKMFWLIKSLPIKLEKFFLTKFFVYLPIVLIPGWVITSISNLILKVDTTVFLVSMIIITTSSFVILVAGYSLGILFPKKDYKDIPEIETSFGGLIFIVLSLCYIILTLSSIAEPVRKYIIGKHLNFLEMIFYTFLFLTINFIYAFSCGYYAKKKFVEEY